MQDDPLFLWRVCASALRDICLAVACGLLLAERWLRYGASAPLRYRLRPALQFVTAGLVVAGVAHLVVLSATFAGVVALRPAVEALPDVLPTHPGRVDGCTLAAALTLFACCLPRRRSRTIQSLTRIAFLAELVCVTATGHAAADGYLTQAELLQCVHLAAMCLWSGGVIVSGLLVVPALASVPPAPATHMAPSTGQTALPYLRSLSGLSTYSVVAVFASGAYKGYAQLGGQLAQLQYGLWSHILLLKMVCVTVALLLGARQRWWLRTGSIHLHPYAVRTLHWEAAAMLAVLLLSAALGNAPPP